jgi:hypothetical protein
MQVAKTIQPLDHSGSVEWYCQMAGEAIGEVIWLDPMPQPFGGVRWWLRCPHCAHRRGRLFPVSGRLRCRACARLAYVTQRQDRATRLRWKAVKLLRRAGVTSQVAWVQALEALSERPKGMRRRTFQRLKDAHWDAIEQHEEWFMGEAIRRFGHLLRGRVR